jgi:anti-sigma-K factor RskA
VNCVEAEDLLGAYALDALPEQEAAAMQAHISSCAEHAAKVADLRGVAVELSALAEPMETPPRLRARVLDAVAATSARSTAQREMSRASALARGDQDSARLNRASLYRWGALAAAVLVMLGSLLAWNLILMNRDNRGVDQFATRATSIATLKQISGATAGTVVYFDGDKKALVVLDSLPPLDASKNVYEMWAVDGSQAESIGLMQSDGAQTKVVVPFDSAKSPTIAITVEPVGGSPQPTNPPIITASCVDATTCGT